MIKTIHTLSIKDFSLYEETGDSIYLMKVKFPKIILKFYSVKLNKLKEDLIQRFNTEEYGRIAETESLLLYYYYKIMEFSSMYDIFRIKTRIKKIEPDDKVWYKTVMGLEYGNDTLKQLREKRDFFLRKYNEAAINKPKHKGESYTINDMISGIEGVMGVGIDRTLPVSALSSYIKASEKKLRSLKKVNSKQG